jgi:hypothetical protein
VLSLSLLFQYHINVEVLSLSLLLHS